MLGCEGWVMRHCYGAKALIEDWVRTICGSMHIAHATARNSLDSGIGNFEIRCV